MWQGNCIKRNIIICSYIRGGTSCSQGISYCTECTYTTSLSFTWNVKPLNSCNRRSIINNYPSGFSVHFKLPAVCHSPFHFSDLFCRYVVCMLYVRLPTYGLRAPLFTEQRDCWNKNKTLLVIKTNTCIALADMPAWTDAWGWTVYQLLSTQRAPPPRLGGIDKDIIKSFTHYTQAVNIP